MAALSPPSARPVGLSGAASKPSAALPPYSLFLVVEKRISLVRFSSSGGDSQRADINDDNHNQAPKSFKQRPSSADPLSEPVAPDRILIRSAHGAAVRLGVLLPDYKSENRRSGASSIASRGGFRPWRGMYMSRIECPRDSSAPRRRPRTRRGFCVAELVSLRLVMGREGARPVTSGSSSSRRRDTPRLSANLALSR